MNPSTACAQVIVDELVRIGCRHAVLCPGSRSAPLAYALAQADVEGRLTLHVRVDERSAAFLAVGLAKATRRPAPIVTTSGTAVANLHPAVLEADSAGVPLVVLSADRPPELRGTGANQTADQLKLYGDAVRLFHDLGTPEARSGQASAWRTAIDRAWSAAVGDLGGRAGPVHINVPLRDPLTVDLPTADWLDDAAWPEPLAGRGDGGPWTRTGGSELTSWWSSGRATTGVAAVPDIPRTLVVLGDLDAPGATRRVIRAALELGWPVLAEPFGSRVGGRVIGHGPLLAGVSGFIGKRPPERILLVGRLSLSRTMAALLRTPGVVVESVTSGPQWPDPGHVVSRVHPWSAFLARRMAGRSTVRTAEDDAWSRAWESAGDRLEGVIGPLLAADDLWPMGPAVAAALLAALPAGAALFAGSSTSARDLDVARVRDGADVYASRGLAGIDGNVATACGLALAHDAPTYALMGDLTFLHDANALAVGPGEPRPDLTIVVVDDAGGGIFATLEYGAPGRERFFERVFGTPVGSDVLAVAAAHGAEVAEAASRAELIAQVARRPRGVRVVRVRVDRSGHRAAGARLRAAAASALS